MNWDCIALYHKYISFSPKVRSFSSLSEATTWMACDVHLLNVMQRRRLAYCILHIVSSDGCTIDHGTYEYMSPSVRWTVRDSIETMFSYCKRLNRKAKSTASLDINLVSSHSYLIFDICPSETKGKSSSRRSGEKRKERGKG